MRLRPNVPMAIQVANTLRKRIRREFAKGGRLPGEHNLAGELGVSRGTVRQALSILEQEGVVIRQQGNGTFSNPNVIGVNTRIDLAYEFAELIETSGFEASVQLLDVRRDLPADDIAQRLNIKPDTPVIIPRKVFFASKRPAIYVIEYIPTSIVREPYSDDEFANTIFTFLEQRCQSRVDYIVSEIVPCVADTEISGRLGIEVGEPVLKFAEVFFSTRNRPVAVAIVYFREPIIRFHALRKMSHIV